MKQFALKLASILRIVGALGAVFVATMRDAYAYVDPGTGAMILQVIGAAVAGALFYFRQLRAMIAEWFAKLTSRSKTDKV